MEEPENGIHPKSIPAMLKLLLEIAVDSNISSDISNPLRQVIINTHSPGVVREVPEDSLIAAEVVTYDKANKQLCFFALPNMWRVTLAAEGPTDRALLPIVKWLWEQSHPDKSADFKIHFSLGPP
jgi:hypothetical protein